MKSQKKNILYSLLMVGALFGVWKYREYAHTAPVIIEGETMGTTYHITYFDRENRNLKPEIDSLLTLLNKSISTYDSSSEISAFNKASRSFRFRLPYFLPLLLKSREVVTASNGAFDPTIMPLVNLWGFGPEKNASPDTARIELSRAFIGFEKINFNDDSVWKSDPRVQLDFSAIGQGYGADVIAGFLRDQSIKEMLIEIGGEGMAIGRNKQSGNLWTLGIVDPQLPTEFAAFVELEDKSFSTSGNYFNFRELNGKRYSHTIDPMSGYPAETDMLSASVFAKDCMTADAWATAMMVMGKKKTMAVLNDHPDLDVLLIFLGPESKPERFASKGIESFISFKVNP